MITNRDIEIAFVRAQNRINEQIEKAQMNFIMPDMIEMADALATYAKRQTKTQPKVNENNPIANEEI